MSVKIEFPETNIVGCKFLKYDSTQRNSCEIYAPGQPGYRPKEFTINTSSKVYNYKCIDGMSKPQLGDIVVVSCASGFALCQVVETNVIMPENADLAYVVGVVDVSNYLNFLQREKEKEQLKRALIKKKEEIEKSAVFEMLAEKDDSFAEMLKKFKELGGSF